MPCIASTPPCFLPRVSCPCCCYSACKKNSRRLSDLAFSKLLATLDQNMRSRQFFTLWSYLRLYIKIPWYVLSLFLFFLNRLLVITSKLLPCVYRIASVICCPGACGLHLGHFPQPPGLRDPFTPLFPRPGSH